ncbi:hypothetical protein BDU57DRAFT_523206 [Ampelomyces quisqualis]|uniref:Uncharacterized protein n=1 Tax=Ampelomyces quisqualis TaxID=50730 RepID=A0A6A5Q9B6_AMPQU|nr:hypothetical protein BDU57DRAFT_523206 [Ampelomyces quisqualis]
MPKAVVPRVFPRPLTALPTPETTGGILATAESAVPLTAPIACTAPDTTGFSPDPTAVSTAATALPTPKTTLLTALPGPASKGTKPEEGLGLAVLRVADLPVPRLTLRLPPTASPRFTLEMGFGSTEGKLTLTLAPTVTNTLETEDGFRVPVRSPLPCPVVSPRRAVAVRMCLRTGPIVS